MKDKQCLKEEEYNPDGVHQHKDFKKTHFHPHKRAKKQTNEQFHKYQKTQKNQERVHKIIKTKIVT